MKHLSLLLIAGVVLAADPSVGQNQKAQQANGQSSQAAASSRVTYIPPNRKTPGGRIGGGTRGAVDHALTVEVLAPDDHIGWSATAQPTLYIYLSQAVTQPLEVTIDTDEFGKRHEPLLEVTLDQDQPAGVFPISLRDYKVRLAPEVTYRWSVAIIINPDQRANDLIASGLIQYVPPPADFSRAVTHLQGNARMRSYAERGYWYDAINTVSQGAGRQPDWRQQRADLLDQVRLPGPAASDRMAEPKQ